MNKKALILTLAVALPASLTFAQRPGGGPPPGGIPPGPPPREGGGDRPPRNRPPRDGGDKERPDKPPVPPLIHTLDGDHDGIISADEIKAAPDSLKALDKNKDGKLTPNEFTIQRPDGPPPGASDDGGEKPKTRNAVSERNRPPEPFPGQKPPGDGDQKPAGPKDGEGKPQRPPPPPLIGALDADHDGVISADEIADASKSLLTLDKNSDGQLGPVEYMGRPPGDRPPGERPDGDGPKPPLPPKEDQ